MNNYIIQCNQYTLYIIHIGYPEDQRKTMPLVCNELEKYIYQLITRPLSVESALKAFLLMNKKRPLFDKLLGD